MDTYKRTLAKALSWRFLATIITTAVALAITGELKYAATIGLLDTILKLGAYVAHERLWNRVAFGRAKAPEYQI